MHISTCNHVEFFDYFFIIFLLSDTFTQIQWVCVDAASNNNSSFVPRCSQFSSSCRFKCLFIPSLLLCQVDICVTHFLFRSILLTFNFILILLSVCLFLFCLSSHLFSNFQLIQKWSIHIGLLKNAVLASQACRHVHLETVTGMQADVYAFFLKKVNW